MPPLAMKVWRQFTLPLKDRKMRVRDDILRHMTDVHFFEVTDIWEAAHQLTKDGERPDADLVFLPAPRTWLECYLSVTKMRIAFLLVERSDGMVEVGSFSIKEDGTVAGVRIASPTQPDPYVLDLRLPQFHVPDLPSRDANGGLNREIIAMHLRWYLSMINQPKFFGRRTVEPHRGLVRELHRVGRYGINAWTEIKLLVGAPKDQTGQLAVVSDPDVMPLHYVRSHWKPSIGRRIAGHWRGNAAFGIVLARYKVEHRK